VYIFVLRRKSLYHHKIDGYTLMMHNRLVNRQERNELTDLIFYLLHIIIRLTLLTSYLITHLIQKIMQNIIFLLWLASLIFFKKNSNLNLSMRTNI